MDAKTLINMYETETKRLIIKEAQRSFSRWDSFSDTPVDPDILKMIDESIPIVNAQSLRIRGKVILHR